jgi:hypothetical protein
MRLPQAPIALRSCAALIALAFLTGGSVVSCAGDPVGSGGGSTDPDNRPNSLSLGRWSPPTDTTRYPNACPKALHDTYFVIGPDGRKYPTWHPPSTIDPDTGRLCYFGHEHGDDPRASGLFDDLRRHFAWDANGNGRIDDSEWSNDRTGVPFGYVVEYATDATARAANTRHESYKIAWSDAVLRRRLVNGNEQSLDLSCDILLAYAQDSFSTYAVNEALHPLTYAINCNRGTEAANLTSKMIVSVLADFGSSLAPPPSTAEVAAQRLLPQAETQVYPSAFVTSAATSDLLAALEERWDTVVSVTSSSGSELARFNPGLVVRTPARFQLNASAIERSILLCYSGVDGNGFLIADPAQAGSIRRQVRGSTDCARLSATGPSTPLAQRIGFDARDAQFKGCSRQVVLRSQSIRNGTGPTTWYSTATGSGARTTSFSGGIRQYIDSGVSSSALVLAPVTNDATVVCDASSGVHVPGQ